MSDARSITLALGGTWRGRYGTAFCPAHNNTHTPALSLADGGEGRLLACCHAGCSFIAVLGALRDHGIVDQKKQVKPFLRAAGPIPLDDAQRRRGLQAKKIWAGTKPVGGTLAEVYLRHRGITCDLPATLRFHPSCWHEAGESHPALVGLIEGGRTPAVHRVYLAPDGLGKASVKPNKSSLGTAGGGAVRLGFETGPLIVAEGIETALSLQSGLLASPGRVLAAPTTSGIKGLLLPVEPGELVIASDGDRPGRQAAQSLAFRATALGWKVSSLSAPDGFDFNDVLQGRT